MGLLLIVAAAAWAFGAIASLMISWASGKKVWALEHRIRDGHRDGRRRSPLLVIVLVMQQFSN